MAHTSDSSFAEIAGFNESFPDTALAAQPRPGRLPFEPRDLLEKPSGNLFGWIQNVGMGWEPAELRRDEFLILSTAGGLRADDGTPVALGYHTGHWEVGLLVRRVAETLREMGATPFAGFCSDPCDGRTQGTAGMMDSLPFRNDAAIVLRRLIRSLPTASGVIGIATCDKGLPAMMLALAGTRTLPGVIVPGGVTLPASDSEDAGTIQSIGARFAHGLITLEHAATMGCRACGSPGGGCQFLGTAATAQVLCEALGIAVPHSALSPSGQPVWLDVARRSALALVSLHSSNTPVSALLTSDALENAMLTHAAFGGSTNMLLHVPALALAAGLKPPNVDDWTRVNRSTPRLVDVLPNGPRNHPTVQVYMAGGVLEVMRHLRRLGVLKTGALTASGRTVGELLDAWEDCPRRWAGWRQLREAGVEATEVIMDPDSARRRGLTGTIVFPGGNLAPEGSVIKATAIDPSVVGQDGVFRHRGRARVFTSEKDAVAAIKGISSEPIRPGEVLVLIGAGPLGRGMEEIYQVTSALKFIPWGKTVPVVSDARFSGVSTGACVGHVSPEALAGGPIGKLRDGDIVEIEIDRLKLSGRVCLVGSGQRDLSEAEARETLESRPLHPGLQIDPALPDDTRLWALLQWVSGGTWAGCVYDLDRIEEVIRRGMLAGAGSETSSLPQEPGRTSNDP